MRFLHGPAKAGHYVPSPAKAGRHVLSRRTRGPAKGPVEKPLTAKTAETAKKKILGILGELCVLCGKTSHLSTRSRAGHHVPSPAKAGRHVFCVLWRQVLWVAVILVIRAVASPVAQESPTDTVRRESFDEMLDLYVRDGYVYYRALKIERARFDTYVNWLANVPVDSLSRDEQLAFWLNAYNALVLRTVVDRYPIQGSSPEYPARSIRQIPGAFERLPHRVAGRTLTLDQIEQTMLPRFHDPRVYLALGRGSVGGGRLRSEAFSPTRLEAQLTAVANECASRPECLQVQRQDNQVLVSPIFSWREAEFVAAYGGAAPAALASRSPIERAVLAFVEPKLLAAEREFLAENRFRLSYQPFDWSLNDLTGRGGR